MIDRTSETTKWLALLAGLAAAALFVINVTDVIRYQTSGVAVLAQDSQGMKTPVFRQFEPEKFRQVIFARSAYAAGCLFVVGIAFYFFRRVD